MFVYQLRFEQLNRLLDIESLVPTNKSTIFYHFVIHTIHFIVQTILHPYIFIFFIIYIYSFCHPYNLSSKHFSFHPDHTDHTECILFLIHFFLYTQLIHFHHTHTNSLMYLHHSGNRNNNGTQNSEADGGATYETMSANEKKNLLLQICGVVSEHTKKLCTR